MKVLCTGASGFLGSIVVKNLLKLQYEITTIGITKSDNIYCDLRISIPKVKQDYNWVFHLAGKAHIVPKTQKEASEFFQINLEGTKNLIKGIEQSEKLPQCIVFISSAAVYGLNKGEMINENLVRKAIDPYGQSKIQAEDFLLDWGKRNNVKIGIIRPPIVIGLNAPGNLKKMIDGIKSGRYLNIDNGKARRSMVLADDLAAFLPTIAEFGGIYNLTDGQHPSFEEISKLILNHFGKKRIFNLPLTYAQMLAKTGDFAQKIIMKELPFNSRKLEKMTSSLTFDDTKAKMIGWNPRSIITNPQLWLGSRSQN